MDNITALVKEHWDSILITVLAILIFFFAFKNKQGKTRG